MRRATPTWFGLCSVVLGLIIALAGILWADAQSDLDSAKRDHDSLKAKTEELKDRLDKYLEQSRGLRSMDKDQLDSLVEKLCRLDLEPDDREVDSIAKDLTERVVDQVRRRYEETARAGMEMVGLIERHLDNVKALRNRAKDLRSQDAVKDAHRAWSRTPNVSWKQETSSWRRSSRTSRRSTASRKA